MPTLIDCTQKPDLLAGWPVGRLVRSSATACAILDDLAIDWMLTGADLDGREYDIDVDNRLITINTDGLGAASINRSHHFQKVLILRTLSALRAAWQAERADDAFIMHRVDVWPLLARILAADTTAMTMRMAREIHCEIHEKTNGRTALWRYALADENGDMAACYMRGGDVAAFRKWFEKDTRMTKCDFDILADMDAVLGELSYDGRGTLSEGAVRCLTIDPLTGASYLGMAAGEIAGNPALRGFKSPVAEAHFAQIMDEIGATRVGHVALRDKKLAARLFPDQLVHV